MSTTIQPLEARLEGFWRPRWSPTREATSIKEIDVPYAVVELAPSSPVILRLPPVHALKTLVGLAANTHTLL
jgi:hypothetical protein